MKILYDFENITNTLELLEKEVYKLENIKEKINTLSTNYSEINLNNCKKSIANNIDSLIDNYLSEIQRAKNISNEFNQYENNSVNINEFLNKVYIDIEILQQLGWTNITPEQINNLNFTLKKYEINTSERIKHFLSQCSHESGCGKSTEEQSSGKDYENRSDLGNNSPGDGIKYKGAGYIQLTGKNNYVAFADSIGDSEIINQGYKYVAENYPWESAGFWWQNNGMNDAVDSGATVEQITRRVNGGYNGLDDRKQYYEKINNIYK